jgi:type I restriction enzyme S subunit
MEKEWEIDKFSNIFTCIPNNTLSRADLNYSGGRVKNIHYGDILTRFRECLDVRRSRLPFISENNDVERYFMSLLKNGDLIIADTAEDEIVGKCAELQGISDEFVVAGLHTIAIRPNNKFANCYLAFYMNSSAYRKQLTPLMQGVKVLSISRSAISKTEIYFPSSILEQEKIAKCLDSLENLIESYERKIEVLNIQKKGLMQKLFPRL